MTEESRHFQSLSVTILAIGTAALGFGLFGSDFDASEQIFFRVRIVSGAFAIIFYVMLVLSVARILSRTGVSGDAVVMGPMFWMFELMVAIAVIFVMDPVEMLVSG